MSYFDLRNVGYHKQEFTRELTLARDSLERLRWDRSADAARRRWEIESLLSRLVHAAEVHADPPMSILDRRLPTVKVGSLDEALRQGAQASISAARLLAAVGAPSSGTELLPTLAAVNDALAAAVAAHHLVDPFAEMDEAHEQQVAVPERIVPQADASRLTACTVCDARLGPDDRTATGTYCEACRTRFVAR